MLLINTLVGQTIYIDNQYKVKVSDIDPRYNEVYLKLDFGDGYQDDIIKTGVTKQLLPKVTITPTRILEGEEVIVVLGFNAPRNISIKGEWSLK